MDILKVKFHHEETGVVSQIYRGLNNRFYSRSPEGKWYSVSYDGRYYERDCSLKKELTVQVVGEKGQIYFEESNGKENEDPFPFVKAVCKKKKAAMVEKLNLSTYEDWKKWLVESMESHSFNGYKDNWLYDATNSEETTFETLPYLDRILEVVVWKAQHNVTKQEWVAYGIREENELYLEEIIGYRYNTVIEGVVFYESDNAQMAIDEVKMKLEKTEGVENIKIKIENEYSANNKEYPADMVYELRFLVNIDAPNEKAFADLEGTLIGFNYVIKTISGVSDK